MVAMGGAVVFHLARREGGSAGFTAVLLALVTFVACARWQVVPL